MPDYIDQTGQTISLSHTPTRIVSLVPSQTELLADLGLNEEVAGITKFCIHPGSWFRSKQRVGGTKQLSFDKIQALKPDLVIANKEENVKEQIEELAKHYPVWTSNINNLPDAYEMIEQIGKITDRSKQANGIIDQIKKNFAQLSISNFQLSTCYLIWRDPYMTVGHDTFIHSMMELAGFKNIFSNRIRYPEINIKDLDNCELLLLSSEPFPFKQKHIDELKEQGVKAKIVLVDGEMFSWYGSRLLKAAGYFIQLKENIAEDDRGKMRDDSC